MRERLQEIDRRAADRLMVMFRSGEHGLPGHPESILAPPAWCEPITTPAGKTVAQV